MLNFKHIMMNINSEIIAGLAIAGMGIIFLFAGFVNPVWALIMEVDIIIIVLGIATLGHGFWTLRNEKRNPVKSHHHH